MTEERRKSTEGDGVVIGANHGSLAQSLGQSLRWRGAVGGGFDLQRGDEGGAAADLTSHAHGAAHEGAEALADDETEAGAAVFASDGGIDLGKGFEQAVDAVGGDADAGVAHRDGDHAVPGAESVGIDVNVEGNLDGDAAARRELDGVVDQVGEDLTKPVGVADQLEGDGGVDVVNEFNFAGGGLHGEQVASLLDGADELERLVLDVELAGFDLREIEDVVDDGEEGLAAGADGADGVALFVGERGVEKKARHADDAVHGRADLVGHGGEELALGAGGVVGLGLGAAEGGFRLDARGDVGSDGDEVFEEAVLVAHGLDLELEVKFTPRLGVIDDLGGEDFALCDGVFDEAERIGVGRGAGHELEGFLTDDFLEAVFHHAFEGFVDPLGGAVGRADEHEVVGAAGHEGEFAGGGLALAEGLFGLLACGDVLQGADDARGFAGQVVADGFRAGVEPAPGAGGVAHAVFGIDEVLDAVELAGQRHAVVLKIIGVHERLPRFEGGNRVRRRTAQHK